MLGKSLLILSALALAAAPAAAQTGGHGASKTGGGSYGDRNRGGPHGFYSYPSHRHVDGGTGSGLDHRFSATDPGTSPNSDRNYGSAYYGGNYGAPYHGGGYYDGGTYYRDPFN